MGFFKRKPNKSHPDGYSYEWPEWVKPTVCPECGGPLMYNRDSDDFYCTTCADKMDRYAVYDPDEDEEFFDGNSGEDSEVPEGCLACGGPYPFCCDSCNLMDD